MVSAAFRLILESLIPVVVAVIIYTLDKKTVFANISNIAKQVIIGIIFGIIAVLGTEYGINMNGFNVNCRDAAPMVAGLLFGGPAGIIAGLIGGLERWFAVYWGIGTFTRVACSISTVLAGFYAAVLKKFLLAGKKPTPVLALGCGAVIEVFHLMMVFITNVSEAEKAIKVIDACFVPMVSAVAFSCFCATLLIAILSRDFSVTVKTIRSKTPLFTIIQRWLLAVFGVAFFLVIYFDYRIQTETEKRIVAQGLEQAIDETAKDINDRSNDYMISIAKLVKKELISNEFSLQELADHYELSDIVVVNGEGIVVESNNTEYIGFDMSTGEQSAEFLCLLEDKDEYVQEMMPTTADKNKIKKFAGVSYADGFVQISYDDAILEKHLDSLIYDVANNKHVNGDGGVVIFNKTYVISSLTSELDKKAVYAAGIRSLRKNSEGQVFSENIGDEEYYEAVKPYYNYYIAALYPVDTAEMNLKLSMYIFTFSMVLVFAAMYALIYALIKNVVVRQIIKVNGLLSDITGGDLDVVVNVRTSSEFSSLSDDINSTVNTLKRLIAEAAARIDAELVFAKNIQESAMPNTFPAFPDINSFDIYARMYTAKEVGGDFYDYYMTDANTLQFIIADVSGKGIPAAMFMMRAKSTLKGLSERGEKVNEVFTQGNNSLCQGNEAGMFVTAWQGSIDLRTGLVEFANAGHNMPVLKRKGEKFDFYNQKVNLVLAGMEGIKYRINELQLNPGDQIFLYTDGVNEATDTDNELYGDERLLKVLNAREYDSLKELCDAVKEDIDLFVKGRDQFDDITMVAFEYKGY